MRLKTLVAIFFIVHISLHAQQNSGVTISGKYENTSLIGFITSVESQAGFHFYYNPDEFRDVTINLVADGMPLIEVLDLLFNGPDYFHAVDNNKNIFLTRTPLLLPGKEVVKKAEAGAAKDIDELDAIISLRERKLYGIGAKTQVVPGKEITISGYVKTIGTNDAVPGTAVRVSGSTKGTTTDDNGFYSLTLQPGSYTLTYTSVGWKATKRNIRVFSSGTLNVEMQYEITKLQEVEVKSDKTSNTAGLAMGAEKFNIQNIKMIPATFGEADVLKAILTLPGVKTVGEASTGFNVRGGAADQNLILINGSTIYNPFHFFGFFSSFNPEAIQNVELFKGSVPATFGGRLSSVIKVTSREGSKEKFKGSAGIGLLTSRVNLEGPILKNKASFSVGARKTYSNWIFNFLPKSSGYRDSKASFHDINLLVDADLGESNKVRLSGYVSQDESNLSTDTTYQYSNRNFSLQWTHEFSDRLNSVVMLSADHFDYGNFSQSDPTYGYELKFAIDQRNLKVEFNYELSQAHTLNFGVSSLFYKLNPGTYSPSGELSLIVPKKIPTEQGLESALHLEDVFEVTPKFSVNAGIRYSLFNYLGDQAVNYYQPGLPRTEENILESKTFGKGDVINTYHGPEARLSARYLFTENFSMKAGYTVMRQYIHMLSNTIAISPTDIWKLSDPNIKPQLSEQFSVGVYKNISTKLETSVEGYWKTIHNYLDYKSGAVLVMNPEIEQEVVSTQGKAYGIEFFIKKPVGKFNGWMSYTYSRIFLIANDPIAGEKINRGEYYPASYDKPHDFNFIGNQKLTKRFNISLTANYSTGRPVTIPIGVFNYGGSPKTLYSNRNGYRIPDYFRMDLSVNVEGNHRIHQFFHNSWTFGVYNLTGRRNPYSVYYTKEHNVIKGYKISIFGSAIPFINYNIKF
jgi:outer membrane cobalamin receptor